MTVQSMTGFAQISRDVGGFVIQMEARSVNGKGLDFRFRLLSGFEMLEPQLRVITNERMCRGAIHFSFSPQQDVGITQLHVNENYLYSFVKNAKKLELEHWLAQVSADGLLALNGVITTIQAEIALLDEIIVNTILEAFSALLDDLILVRESEGEKLKQIISNQIDKMEQLTKAARQDSARTPKAIRAALMQQLELLLDTNLNQDRLYFEAALLATKTDIAEEVDRLDAHVKAARGLFDTGGTIGRKLDFLAQKFNRETNTLCSNVNVVDQLRDQVQNLV